MSNVKSQKNILQVRICWSLLTCKHLFVTVIWNILETYLILIYHAPGQIKKIFLSNRKLKQLNLCGDIMTDYFVKSCDIHR
jgi:hypothetical protein